MSKPRLLRAGVLDVGACGRCGSGIVGIDSMPLGDRAASRRVQMHFAWDLALRRMPRLRSTRLLPHRHHHCSRSLLLAVVFGSDQRECVVHL
jgi:hypothetical protein